MQREHARWPSTAIWLRFLMVFWWTVFAVAAPGCSYSVDSPELRASVDKGAVVPDLVCTDQLITNVVLNGSGFAPLPIKTLEGPNTQLLLPKIELKATASLDGSAPAGSAIQIPDDPANPGASKVHYLSDTQMSFDITPDQQIPGGVYDIIVTNPDGTHSATWPGSLALIPPPEINDLLPDTICDDQADQNVVINGRYFLRVDGALPVVTVGGMEFSVTDIQGCVELTGNFVEKIEICSSVTINIPTMSLGPGEYDVVIKNPSTASCSSTSVIKLTVHPPPRVDSVVPQKVCTGGSLLTISGANFFTGPAGELPTVELREQGGMGVLPSISVEMSKPETELKATFGPGVVPGIVYEVVVKNPDGCEDRPLPHKEVTGTEGPILFFVDPPVVSNVINTRVTLFSTAINKPLAADAVTIIPAGQTMPVTVLSHNDVMGYPKRLQAVVPAGLPAGSYDVYLRDASDCAATVLPGGLTIAADQNITLLRVEPPFGDTAMTVPITIFRDTNAAAPNDAPFVSTPSVLLNPAASTNPDPMAVGIEVNFVTVTDPDTMTAVVPANTPEGLYDLVVVNPDGKVGVLPDAYRSLKDPPPVIESVTPPSVAASSGQVVTIEGDDFRMGALVSLSCVDAAGNPVASPMVTNTEPTCDANGENCSMTATINASTLSQGSVCVLRVTNTDGSFGDFSAIGVTNSSLNLETPKAGTMMNIGRRGLVSAAAKATNASRFVFAIGGDDGAAMNPVVFNSVESAPVDLYGKMGAWTMQRYSLNTPRVFASSATSGRYIYVGGGNDGMKDLDTVERAMLLSPGESPEIVDVDLTLTDIGLDKGQWFYRVAAVFDAADLDNPGGESLASDEFAIKLPSIANKKITVTLSWSAPQDSLGNLIPNVVGYRIYRTAMADGTSFSEVLLAETNDPMNLKFVDDGSAMPGTEVPLPLGSTGKWAVLPNLSVPRSGSAFAIGPDPDLPDTKLYLYALLGKNDMAVLNSYEYLNIDVTANGHQTAGNMWTVGAATATARWHHGVWVADRTIRADIGQMPNDPDTTYIYLGGGQTIAGAGVNTVHRGRITPGGALDALANTNQSFGGSSWAGYGVLAAAQQLFVFGGDQGNPATKGISASIINAAGALANNSWNAGLSLNTPRVFMGSSVQSAFAFFIGGRTNVDAASTSTEYVVW